MSVNAAVARSTKSGIEYDLYLSKVVPSIIEEASSTAL